MGLWHGLIEGRRGRAFGAGGLLQRYLEKENDTTRLLFVRLMHIHKKKKKTNPGNHLKLSTVAKLTLCRDGQVQKTI